MMRLGTDYFDLKECPKAAIVVHNNYIVGVSLLDALCSEGGQTTRHLDCLVKFE